MTENILSIEKKKCLMGKTHSLKGKFTMKKGNVTEKFPFSYLKTCIFFHGKRNNDFNFILITLIDGSPPLKHITTLLSLLEAQHERDR